MSDYIERQSAIEAIKNDSCELVYYSKADAISCLEAEPAANVREDVRGEWIDFRGKPQCFNCKAVWPEDYYQHNFCPRCGARMTGGGER